MKKTYALLSGLGLLVTGSVWADAKFDAKLNSSQFLKDFEGFKAEIAAAQAREDDYFEIKEDSDTKTMRSVDDKNEAKYKKYAQQAEAALTKFINAHPHQNTVEIRNNLANPIGLYLLEHSAFVHGLLASYHMDPFEVNQATREWKLAGEGTVYDESARPKADVLIERVVSKQQEALLADDTVKSKLGEDAVFKRFVDSKGSTSGKTVEKRVALDDVQNAVVPGKNDYFFNAGTTFGINREKMSARVEHPENLVRIMMVKKGVIPLDGRTDKLPVVFFAPVLFDPPSCNHFVLSDDYTFKPDNTIELTSKCKPGSYVPSANLPPVSIVDPKYLDVLQPQYVLNCAENEYAFTVNKSVGLSKILFSSEFYRIRTMSTTSDPHGSVPLGVDYFRPMRTRGAAARLTAKEKERTGTKAPINEYDEQTKLSACFPLEVYKPLDKNATTKQLIMFYGMKLDK